MLAATRSSEVVVMCERLVGPADEARGVGLSGEVVVGVV